jgi:hypothetical protein
VGERAFSLGGCDLDAPLRLAALYFDLAIQPANRIVHVRADPYLEKKRFLKKVYLPASASRGGLVANGKYAGQLLSNAMLLHSLDSLPASQNGRWSILGGHPDSSATADEFDTLYLEILGHFPVPSPQANIEDILMFNRQHREQLIEFRNSVAGAALKLASAKSEAAIADLVRDEVYAKLDSIERSLNRSIGARILERFSIGISIPGPVIAGMCASLGVPVEASLLLGNATNIAFSKAPIQSKKLAPDCHYVFDAHKTGLFS